MICLPLLFSDKFEINLMSLDGLFESVDPQPVYLTHRGDTCVQLQHVDWTQMCKYFTFNCFCHSLKHICFLFWAEIVGLLEVIKKYSRKILFDVSFLLSAQFRCTLQKGLCFQWIYNTYLHWSQYFILENGCNNHKTLQLYRRLQKSIMYDATMPRRQRWTGSTW